MIYYNETQNNQSYGTEPNGELSKRTREFATFIDELSELAGWLKSLGVELAVMESTGVYWKSLYDALEAEGLRVYVVNARHIKRNSSNCALRCFAHEPNQRSVKVVMNLTSPANLSV